jgi:hypothetical protein
MRANHWRRMIVAVKRGLRAIVEVPVEGFPA